MTNVKLAGWSPNHFVQCVKKVFEYTNTKKDKKSCTLSSILKKR